MNIYKTTKIDDMRSAVYTESVIIPSVEDFAIKYPQYAPFAQGEGRSLFEKLTSPDSLIMAKAATNLALPAVQGIAELCNHEFSQAAGDKAKRFLSQFIGAVTCTMMESNGFARSGKKKSVHHANFSKSEFFIPALLSSRLSAEEFMIQKLLSWNNAMAPEAGNIQLLDFFCGCGGMSLGFLASCKYKILGGLDINQDAIRTYSRNIRAKGYEQDIVKLYEDGDVLEDFLNKVGFDKTQPSVIIGCAPCQGFSAHRKKHKGTDDKRNSLVSIFASIAAQIDPDCIVMENVPELLSGKYAAYFQEARVTLENSGYNVCASVVNAAEFGVPQARFRALIVASKKNTAIPQSLLSHADFKTVKDAIGLLPPIGAGEVTPNDKLHRCAKHKKSTIETIRQVPRDGGSRPPGVGPKCLDEVNGFYDVYGRLPWSRPAITITHYARNPASGRFVHPEQDRGLTLREMACLQSFPISFDFCGSFDSIARQIGEAVPPVLAAAVAGSVYWDLQRKD